MKTFLKPGESIADSLGRTTIHVPNWDNFHSDLAILTCASEGWETWLEGCWNALQRNSPEHDGFHYDFFVMNVGNFDSIHQLCVKHGWNEIACTLINYRLGTQSKAVLYSASRVLPHKRFICIDSDWFAMTCLLELDLQISKHPEKIGICMDHGWITRGVRQGAAPKQFHEAVTQIYRSDPYKFVDGLNARVFGNHIIINDGMFIGDKWALANLDDGIRRWQSANAAKMPPGTWGLNQGICNAVLCDTQGGFILPTAWNVHIQAASCTATEGERPTFNDPYLRRYDLLERPFLATREEVEALPRYSEGAEVHTIKGLHFAGRGKKMFQATQIEYMGRLGKSE